MNIWSFHHYSAFLQRFALIQLQFWYFRAFNQLVPSLIVSQRIFFLVLAHQADDTEFAISPIAFEAEQHLMNRIALCIRVFGCFCYEPFEFFPLSSAFFRFLDYAIQTLNFEFHYLFPYTMPNFLLIVVLWLKFLKKSKRWIDFHPLKSLF